MECAMSKGLTVGLGAAFFSILMLSSSVCFAGAMDDLKDMSNTGSSFDGSDGQRSGMDIAVSPSSGNIPEASAPQPVDQPEPVVQAEPEPAPAPEPVVQAEPTPAPEPQKEGSFDADKQ
jgi:hypothetical protein